MVNVGVETLNTYTAEFGTHMPRVMCVIDGVEFIEALRQSIAHSAFPYLSDLQYHLFDAAFQRMLDENTVTLECFKRVLKEYVDFTFALNAKVNSQIDKLRIPMTAYEYTDLGNGVGLYKVERNHAND